MTIVPQDTPSTEAPQPRKPKRSHGEGAIRKRVNKSGLVMWDGAIMLGYTEEGKRRVFHCSGKTRREVLEAMQRAVLDKEQVIPRQPLTADTLAAACGTDKASVIDLLAPLTDVAGPIDGDLLWRIIKTGAAALSKRQIRQPMLLAAMQQIVRERDQYRCRYCGKDVSTGPSHIDHIVPVSRGGKTQLSNLALACRECNLKKRDSLLSEKGMALLPSGTKSDG